MNKIWIADDEEIERKSLKMLLENTFSDIIVGEATNGFELVQAAMIEQPDVLIVDISMPGMNGLEAIGQLMRQHCNAKIILVTAHGDFEYAQEAIRSHVFDYQLKPIRRERFVEAVGKCLACIAEENRIRERDSHLVTLMDELKPTIRLELMNTIITGDTDLIRMQMLWGMIGMHTQVGAMMIFQFSQPCISQDKYQILSETAEVQRAAKRLGQNVEEFYGGLASACVDGKLTCFLPIQQKIEAYQQKLLCIELSELLIKQLNEQTNICIRVGIGRVYPQLQQLHQSYLEGVRAIHDDGTQMEIRHYDDLFGKDDESKNPLVMQETAIIQLLAQGELQRATHEMLKNVDDVQNNFGFDILKEYASEAFMSLLGKQEGAVRPWAGKLKCLLDEQGQICTVEELKKWLSEGLQSVFGDMAQQTKKRSVGQVEDAICYVQEHFHEDISLEMVAEQVDISPYYLSRLFKEKINENFVTYLTRVRMEHAKELLKHRKCTLKEASQCVGFSNETYFCKVFKRIVGMTVAEYRANC